MSFTRRTIGTALALAAAAALPVLALAACGGGANGSGTGDSSAGAGDAAPGGGSDTARAASLDTARATFAGTGGQQIGRALLIGTPHGVLIRATLEDIAPGTHAFHLHETGSCSPDFTASGGHFNPRGTAHGFYDPGGRHAGDLPNVHVPEGRSLEVSFFADLVTLREGEAALLDEDGAAIVIHREADDYRTDPAGAGGERIACAVIRG